MPGLAILGAGIFAKEAHLPALKAIGSAAPTLLAVYSRSAKSANSLASEAQSVLALQSLPDVYSDDTSSLSKLLERRDIGYVIVVLPIPTQPEIVIQCLEAGKHVISEKPVAPTAAGGYSLVDTYLSTYASKGLRWRVAENFAAEPGYRLAGKLISDGKIGDVRWWTARATGYVDENSKWYKTPWRTEPEYQGGFLLDGGVHTVAALRTMLPSSAYPTVLTGHASLNKAILFPHDTILAVCSHPPSSSPPTYDPEHPKNGDAIPSGVFEMSFAMPSSGGVKGVTNGFAIVGSKGTLGVRTANGNIILTLTVAPTKAGDEEKVETFEEKSCGVEIELKEFFADVQRGGDCLQEDVGLLGAVGDVAFIEAALGSSGKELSLPIVGK